MSDPVDGFVEDAPAVATADAEQVGEYVHVYRGELADRDGEVRFLALAPGVDSEAVSETFARTAADWHKAATHPNIVSVYERGDDPRPWLAVDPVDRGDLSDTRSNLSPRQTEVVITGTAEAVRNAALYNTAHGALRPESVWVVPDGDSVTPLVDDWGLRQSVRTAAGVFEPTPYTAPEQLDDPTRSADRTDVYGLGAVAYYALTGEPPVEGPDLAAAIREGDVTPPSELSEALSDDVDDVLLKAVATEPVDRYESPYAFSTAFGRAYDSGESEPETTAESTGRKVSVQNGSRDTPDESTRDSDGTSRRTALAAVGLGVVGIGGGWLAKGQLGDNGAEPQLATDDRGRDSPATATRPSKETSTQRSAQTESEAPLVAQNGLAIHGGLAYLVSEGQIRTVSLDTGSVRKTLDAPDGRPRGLAYGNGSLWFADGVGPDYDGEVLELDPDSGAVRARMDSSWDPRGLAFGDGSLWVVDITTNAIVEFTPDGVEVDRFDVRGPTGTTTPRGLAYSGGSLWLGTIDGALYEFTLDGELLTETGNRNATYGGLAVAEETLYGPDSDGRLTAILSLAASETETVTEPDPTDTRVERTANGEIVEAGKLISRWPFQSNYSDVVGDNDATIERGEAVIGTYNERTAVAFDGSVGMMIDEGTNSDLSILAPDSGASSVSAWVYFDEPTGSRNNGDGEARHHLLRNDHEYNFGARPTGESDTVELYFHTDGYSTAEQTDDELVVSTDEWHHFLYTIDPNKSLTFYLNGKQQFHDSEMGGASGTESAYWSHETIGSWYGTNDPTWYDLLVGKLSDLRIYDTGLSDGQVAQIYANTE